MKSFEKICFRGTFRDYQQRVLNNKDKYLVNGKINIVAAPGSGKTILGLELIKELNSPTIILSPTTTIKHQWGERFKESFLPDGENIDDYFSYDLNEITLINSITYQALYSAMNKIKCENDEEVVDYSNIDLFRLLKEYNVKTICLDEAHHLQNEWQKALEKFVETLDKDIRIIALTATPPYDASKGEWERYIKVCGEIDEEIFVPELVSHNTLCPHQDYIYFNFPTDEEIKRLADYKTRIIESINEIYDSEIIDNVYGRLVDLYKNNLDKVFNDLKYYVALLVICQNKDIQVDKKIIFNLTRKRSLPSFNLEFAELGIQYLLDDEELLDETEKENLRFILKRKGTLDRKYVCFSLNDNLKKKLVSSVGKLESISIIVKSEVDSLKDKLRLLILTDYIRKETIADVGTNKPLTSINIVSIFESLRRSGGYQNIGVLSGNLVILPTKLDELIKQKHSSKVIEGTEYSSYTFPGSNKNKVDIVGKLFEKGDINILVGTKSLLGEGWDSPCINSLILATFVGSFMLSNQMRGRAIRKDKNNPDKVSNIWHLVTLEPEYMFKDNIFEKARAYSVEDFSCIHSYDYEILTKRFDSFVGPNYKTGEIESGIARVSIIDAPYTRKHIEEINTLMLSRAKNRQDIDIKWDTAISTSKEISIEAEVPTEKIIKPKVFYNFKGLIAVSLVEIGFISCFGAGFRIKFEDPVEMILYLAAMAILTIISSFVMVKLIKAVLNKNSYTKVLKMLASATLKTFQEIGEISYGASIKVQSYNNDLVVRLAIGNASIREQNVFNQAMNELLGYIENPRYLIILHKNGRKNYEYSMSCPSFIAQKKEYVEIFTTQLKGRLGRFDMVYTRNENGRKEILKCRKKSFITYGEKYLTNRKKIINYE